jgi:hypothetical protein
MKFIQTKQSGTKEGIDVWINPRAMSHIRQNSRGQTLVVFVSGEQQYTTISAEELVPTARRRNAGNLS